MATPGGGVQIPIVASVSGFEAAFATIATGATAAAGRIRTAFRGLNSTFATLGLTATAGGFALFVKGSIDAADRLNDLSKATGVAVSSLGGIGLAAEQAGTDLDGVAKAFGRLNLLAADAMSGSEKAVDTFRKLGISVADIRTLKPEELFARVADSFSGFEEDANRAAGANAIFGKSYQSVLPLLDEGGESLRKNIAYYKQYAGVTDALVKQADAFNDELAKSNLQVRSFGNQLAASLLPSMQALTKHFTDAAERGEGFSDSAKVLAGVIRTLAAPVVILAGGFVQLGEAIAGAGAASVAFFSGEFKRAGAIGSDLLGRLDEIGKRYNKLAVDVFNGTADAKDAAESGAGRPKGRPTPNFGAGATGDPGKKELEGRLKALDDLIKEEQDVLRDRERFLTTYYQNDEISISDYFSTRQLVIDEALDRQRAAFAQQERELQAAKSGTADPTKRAEYETKIADVVARRAAVERDAATKSAEGFTESTRAADAFVRKIEQLAVELADLRGDSVVAGLARFDLGNADLKKQLEVNASSADEAIARQATIGLKTLASQRDILASQLSLNAATRDFGLIVEQVGNKQQSVSIAAANGYLSEIEALQKLSDINRSRLDDLAKEIDLATQAAQGLVEKMGADSPEAQAALNFVDQLKLKYQELAQTGDLVAKSFNQIGAGSLSQLFKDIAGGKNALESLKAAAENLVQTSFGKIADSAAQTLFNQGGIFSGFGEAISKLLGTAPQATGAAALATAGTSLTAAGTAITGSVTVLTTAGSSLTVAAGALSSAAAALTAAAAAQSAGTAGDAFGQAAGAFFGSSGAGGSAFVGPSLGYAANGAEYTNGGAYIVGESGRELLIPPKGSRIVPNHRLADYNGGQTMIVNQVINVPPGANTASYAQAARQANRQLAAERLR